EQAIHGGAGHQRVVEERQPLLGASYATELSGEKRECVDAWPCANTAPSTSSFDFAQPTGAARAGDSLLRGPGLVPGPASPCRSRRTARYRNIWHPAGREDGIWGRKGQ